MKKEIKGIILAGGMSTRLFPSTSVIAKPLLPVYDRPMIFYPLNILISGGITDILVIVPPDHSGAFINLLGSMFDKYGIKISFKVQRVARGTADALILGENHVDENNVALIFGDNIFEYNFAEEIKSFESGCRIFAKKVSDPERFGVIKLNAQGEPEAIVEKPQEFVSDLAVAGFYLFDHRAVEVAKNLKPSSRGELEIVDVQNFYLKNGELQAKIFDGAWLDAGTHDSLLDSSMMVRERGISKKFHPIMEEATKEFCENYKKLIKKF
ncbi:MAG: sugar phosphate nucleotidyltransferase [bacterium]